MRGEDGGEITDPFGIRVEARDVSEVFAACGQERLAAFDRDLFQRFKAVGDETGADHSNPFYPGARQLLERFLRVGLQPFRWPEAGLKSNLPTFARQS